MFPAVFSPIFVPTGYSRRLSLLQEKHSTLRTRGVKKRWGKVKNEGYESQKRGRMMTTDSGNKNRVFPQLVDIRLIDNNVVKKLKG